ncbi:hypothetical protein CYLTODRAFT_490576 [Cylindrobasidium torrendii FP15055 ss-10]|uniref:HMG box domain-containing protein n=1 Tax=Cylindrobasidium torrendii FP15055 ss-10 TaxID=1314674 RepID=A0A0D7BBG4_9AGAR|nr:hypothetical protein CYLTODRAFT_490576 [Cylindrobasidium torrendii FP15055 ss-10]
MLPTVHTMHPYTDTRRSRRLSRQVPVTYDEHGWESTTSTCLTSDIDTSPRTISSPAITAVPSRSRRASRKSGTHIPRPSNAFILFRSWYIQYTSERQHAVISQDAGNAWHVLPVEQQEYWRQQALLKKLEHAARYPNYQYAPGSNKPKRSKTKHTSKHTNTCAGVTRCEKAARQVSPPPRTEKVPPLPSPSDTTSASDPSSQLQIDSAEFYFVPTDEIPPLDLYAPAPGEPVFVMDICTPLVPSQHDIMLSQAADPLDDLDYTSETWAHLDQPLLSTDDIWKTPGVCSDDYGALSASSSYTFPWSMSEERAMY